MRIGRAAFEAQLNDDRLSFRDLEAAKQHAAGERMEVADALVAGESRPTCECAHATTYDERVEWSWLLPVAERANLREWLDRQTSN